jgi:hypothetical protein
VITFPNFRNRKISVCAVALAMLCAGQMSAQVSEQTDIRALREQIAVQQDQISKLQAALNGQREILERLAGGSAAKPAGDTVRAAVAPAPQADGGQNTATLAEVAKSTSNTARNLGGFHFSGDFRYRLDSQVRSGNDIAGPLQNVRSRYRFRFNIDKEIDPRFSFHVQLSTAPFTNAITNDQDMGGVTAKHPISISEAFVDYHPNSKFSVRGGRMEEVFADNMRFLWDDDVRFNGFQQVVKLPFGANALGFKSLELRAGEYILSNPAVYSLAPNSPYIAAGYQPGQKVRDANLFHPGFVLKGDAGSRWSQQIFGSMQLYRNANQIQLASTTAGAPLVVSPTIGISLPSALGGSGNATTTPGGAMYSASHFQIAHFGYRLERKGVKVGNREMPAYVDFQASRNVGTGRLRDAFIASANLGATRNPGDVRFLYQYAVKDANSMISQFTDDDLGTGTGVNIRVHALRFDLALTRFLVFQNLLFVQDPRTGNDPANHIFVPLQRGANTTYRYLGQLAFTF